MPNKNLHISQYFKALIFFSVFILFPNAIYANPFGCAEAKQLKAKTNISFEPEDVQYDFDKTTLEMITEKSGSRDQWLIDHDIDPANIHPDTPIITNGLSNSKFSAEYKYGVVGKPLDKFGLTYCLYVDHVTVRIRYKNTIVIPTEIIPNSCEFKEKLKHHQKYYLADIKAGETYTNKLKEDIQSIITEAEKPFEYTKVDDAETNKVLLQNALEDAVSVYFKSITTASKKYIKHSESDEEFDRMAQSIKECEINKNPK